LSPEHDGSIARGAYTHRMHDDGIRFRGIYQYPSPETLDHAIATAQQQVDDDWADVEAELLHCFVRRGLSLRIDVTLPASTDRFLAAAILEALAQRAVEGYVEARRGAERLDLFGAGDDRSAPIAR
jgi:hypothetical protein